MAVKTSHRNNGIIRLSLLHAAPKYDDVARNVNMLEVLVLAALKVKPDLIVMPELAVSGYEFYQAMGTSWIPQQVPGIIDRFCRLAQAHQVALILGTPRYDAAAEKYYNTAVFINEQGKIAGQYDKVAVLPGSEGWSTSGRNLTPITWREHKIGLLICADVYTPKIAAFLVENGAEVIISPAAWAPGLHEPSGEWEERSQDTGLNLYVCNRTGAEKSIVFAGSSTVVVAAGQRLLEYNAEKPAILTIDVHTNTWLPRSGQFQVIPVNN